MKRLRHVKGGRQYRNNAKPCHAAPLGRAQWEHMYEDMVDAPSTVFSMSSQDFHSCDLNLKRDVDLAENWRGFDPKGVLGNHSNGKDEFTHATRLTNPADRVLRPRFLILRKGGKSGALVARWQHHKQWGWVDMKEGDLNVLKQCYASAASRAAIAASELRSAPGAPCNSPGVCDGDAECNSAGLCEQCDSDMCGLDDCEGSEPDSDPECGWGCEADCDETDTGPTRTCTARCCNGAIIGTPAATSVDQCDAQGQAACAGQGTTLHHVRFGGREQSWHACAKECCAHCTSRSAYHQVLEQNGEWVFEHCTDQARAWCAVGDRGGLADAAWLRHKTMARINACRRIPPRPARVRHAVATEPSSTPAPPRPQRSATRRDNRCVRRTARRCTTCALPATSKRRTRAHASVARCAATVRRTIR